jgi:hypothetical protein
MVRLLSVTLLLALAGCSSVPGVVLGDSDCVKYGYGSFECQVETYMKVGI